MPNASCRRPTPPHADHHGCVARVPLFADLTPAEQDQVAAFARPVHAARGQIVYTADSELRRLLVVHKGRIAMRHVTAGGREQVVRVVGEGGVVGEAAFVMGERPDHEAVAVAASELCTLAHDDLEGLIREHPEIGVRMLQTVTERLVRAERMLAAFATSGVGERLAAWLLDQPTIPDEAGRPVIRLAIPKQELASALGTTAETLSRRLAALVADGLIRLDGRRGIVLLDRPGLASRAGQ